MHMCEPVYMNFPVNTLFAGQVDAFPMSQLRAGSMENPHKQLTKALDILERLARHGLIHCDLNEFNLMVHHDGAVTVIDFPQMISTSHPNAEQYFDRDVQGICKFFYMKMKIAVPAAECPTFKKVLKLQAADDAAAAAEAVAAEAAAATEATGESGEAAASAPQDASVSADGSNNNDDAVATPSTGEGGDSAGAGGEATPTSSGGGGETGGTLQDRAVRAADVRSAKETKRAELVGKRLRLDEQVKASGYTTAAQDAALAKFYEEQAAYEAEARARGDFPENPEDDDDDDDDSDDDSDDDGDGVAEGSDEDGEDDEEEEEEAGDQGEEDGEEAAVGGGGARCTSLGNGTRAASTGKIVPPPTRGRGYVAALNEAAALAAKSGASAAAPAEGVGAVVRSGSNL